MAMMFAGVGNERGLFDPPPVYQTPGIGDGLLGARPLPPQPRRGMMFAGSRAPLDLDMSEITATAAREMGDSQPQAQTATPPISLIDPSAMPERIGDLPASSQMPEVRAKKPAFFGKGGLGWDILGTIGDVAAGAGGGSAAYWPTRLAQKRQQAEWERQDVIRRQDRQWQVEDRDYRANLPQYFMSGRDRVLFDPVSGQSKTVYDAPEDFQEYADLLGLEPGTDEYNDAMQDYVLRSNGPTAQQGRVDLEGVRQGNRVSMEGIRQGNRLSLRQTPTYANTHPRPAAGGSGGGGGGRPPRNTSNVYAPILDKVARGIPLSPGEQQVLHMYGGGRSGGAGGRGAPGVGTGGQFSRTATDPKTGKKMGYNGSKWVPIN